MNAKGFTLIELLIVVAIIALLAAIAFPAYQDYTIRSRTTEALIAASAARDAVMDNAANAAVLDLGIPLFAQASRNIVANGVSVNEQGVISVALTDAAGGGILSLTPNPLLAVGTPPLAPVQWSCAGTNPNKAQLPAECRG